MDYPLRKKSSIIALFCVILIDAMGWGIVYPTFQPLILQNATGLFSSITNIATRNIWYEAMIGIYMIFMFLMSPLLGSLSDRHGRKLILIISMLGSALGFYLCGIGIRATSISLIITGRIIAGATAGSLPIAQAAMIDICEHHEKPKYLSIIAFANLSGFALGPALGALLLDPHLLGISLSYSAPIWLAMSVGILGAILVMTLFSETNIGNSQQHIDIFSGIKNLFFTFVTKKIRILSIIFICYMLAWSMLFSLLPLLLSQKFYWQASEVGFFISFIGLFLGIGVLLFLPRLLKLISINNIIIYSLITLITCTILISLVKNPIFMWLIVILTVCVPFIYVCLATLFSNAVSVDEQGKIMGILGSLVALTWGVGPFLVGSLADYKFIAAIIFILVLLCFSLLIFYKNIMTKSSTLMHTDETQT